MRIVGHQNPYDSAEATPVPAVPEDARWLPTAAAARALGLDGPEAVRALIDSGELQARKTDGGRWQVLVP